MKTLLLFLLSLGSLSGAQIQLVGLPDKFREQVLDALSPRFFYIKQRPATPSRADDAAFLVLDFLKQHGSPNAIVDWSLPGNDTILLKANAGVTQSLGTISVNGWPTEDPEGARKQFGDVFQLPGSNNAKLPFQESKISEGEQRVTDLLKSLGYWNAKTTTTKAPPTIDGTIPVTLNIEPGPRFTLNRPTITSPIAPPLSLVEILDDIVDSPASAENVRRVRASITKAYRSIGYPDAKLTFTREFRESTLALAYALQPGARYQLRQVSVEGLEKTKPSALLAPFKEYEGQPFNQDRFSERVKKLMGTGAFRSVRTEETPLPNQELDITLHLKEADAKGVSLSGGIGSFEGIILGAGYFDRNLFGTLRNLNAGIEYTSLGLLGEVSLQNPFFLGKDLNLTHRAYLITRNYDGYDKAEGGYGIELTAKPFEHYTVTLGGDIFFATIQEDGLPPESLGPTDYLVTRINLFQNYDRRDDAALPSDGWYAELNSSLGIVQKDETLTYFSMEGQLSYYDTRGANSAIAANFRTGLIAPSGGIDSLPIDLRNFEGGSNSVRSFNDRDMGPSANGFPSGGAAWWIANAEYIRTLKGPVKGVVFLDAGALAEGADELFDTDIELAIGLGLRVDLPVGPVRFEYGHSLTKDPGEHSGAFHFSIGGTF
ncbi:BamA/TamA family outer membrane protein [Akkermansiaceae bacterium]|nr:BamA/TamA family outer membrane protein [Akkermansiaceae bacterium]